MEVEFPTLTVFLALLILSTFVFTTNLGERLVNPEAESNLEYYQNLLGFIPARPKIHALITYTFVHVDLFHLMGNLIILIIAGIALEKHIGKIPLISIYISSGCLAVVFDILNRFLQKIPMTYPFVGASGSVFGLIAVASLTRPAEKIPTILVILTFLPFLQLFLDLSVFAEPLSLNTLLLFLFPFVFISLFFLPKYLPLFLATLLFILSWILYIVFNLQVSVSHLGHLGGLLGGFLGILLFPKEKS